MELPTRITWRESGGPVSPPFQYRINLEITANKDGVGGARVVCETKHGLDAATSKDVQISANEYAELSSKLFAHDILKLNADLIGDKRARIGVSFNSFTLEMPNGDAVRFDYLRGQLEQAEFKEYRAVVEVARNFIGSQQSILQDAERCDSPAV
jgi:hypothetical protein